MARQDIASDICKELKKKGKFDEYRKTLAEELRASGGMERLQAEVRASVIQFLAHPSIEGLSRDEVRNDMREYLPTLAGRLRINELALDVIKRKAVVEEEVKEMITLRVREVLKMPQLYDVKQESIDYDNEEDESGDVKKEIEDDVSTTMSDNVLASSLFSVSSALDSDALPCSSSAGNVSPKIELP